MDRKILAQGDRDGACYLYSIANSFTALTTRRLTPAQWKRSIDAVPFKLDNYISGRGTESIDGIPDCLEVLCRSFLAEIKNSQFGLIRISNVSAKSLRASLTNDQVAILAIDDGDHWVSIVDADQSLFYLACSAIALNLEGITYVEAESPNFKRRYNRKMSFAELKVWQNYALLVKNISDSA